MYFDARTAKLLPPDAHLIIDGCVGLRLVAGKTKKTWIYRYKDTAGRMKQIRIGQWPAMPVHKAVDAWKVLKDQRHSGADPVAVRKAARVAILEAVKPPEIYTVARLVDDYTTGHLVQHRKQPGAAAAQAMLCKLLADNPEFANQPAASVTRADAFNILEGKKATPTVAKKLRSLLGAAWDYTMDAGLLVGEVPNWWRSVQKGRLKSKGKLVGGKHLGQARRVLHPGEVTRLLAWLPNMHALGRDCVLMVFMDGHARCRVFDHAPRAHYHRRQTMVVDRAQRAHQKRQRAPGRRSARAAVWPRARGGTAPPGIQG